MYGILYFLNVSIAMHTEDYYLGTVSFRTLDPPLRSSPVHKINENLNHFLLCFNIITDV